MPVKAVSVAVRSAETVDYCETHGEGCKKHRYPHPKIWGHKDNRGRWSMTPDGSLDAELSFRIEQLWMLTRSELTLEQYRAASLAAPCQVVQMPRAEYWKRFGKQSTDVDMRAVEMLRRITQDVREGFGDNVPELEES